jgi:SAM-dependent methyltransferase
MDETQGPGFDRVDDHPEVPVLLAAMEATARWEATIRLRAFEREHLRLELGQRLLDVGFGLGDASLALATDLGSAGEVVGIDASEAMISAARARTGSAPCPMRFRLGDAMALDEPDASFDAVRSERTLQWVPDPAAAIAEMRRVLRPGGRVSLIDSDWSTLEVHIGDEEVEQMVRATLGEERGRPSHVGRRLGDLVDAAGFTLVEQATATHRWQEWDPDEAPAPPGFMPTRLLAAQMVEAGQIDADDQAGIVTTIEDAARAGRFRMALTLHAVVGSA